jgi:hypothetical protein
VRNRVNPERSEVAAREAGVRVDGAARKSGGFLEELSYPGLGEVQVGGSAGSRSGRGTWLQ